MRMDERRRFPRRGVVQEAKARLSTTLPAFPRNEETKTVYLFDVSRQGVGFVGDLQLYPEEQLQLQLGQGQHLDIVVKRCLRLTTGWFQMGGNFVRMGPEAKST